MVLVFPFPHKNPYGEAVISALNMPIETVNGFHYLGIFALLLFFAGLYFLAKALKKYHIRYILLAVILTMVLPMFLVNSFQKTLATGIYAISYEENTSNCRFETIDENTLRGKCELTFENHSKNEVQFAITFYDRYPFEEDRQMISLMKKGAPYKVAIKGKARKLITVETDIDISKMENHIDGGEAREVNIIIVQGKKKRNL